jgi:hypothetical protein
MPGSADNDGVQMRWGLRWRPPHPWWVLAGWAVSCLGWHLGVWWWGGDALRGLLGVGLALGLLVSLWPWRPWRPK